MASYKTINNTNVVSLATVLVLVQQNLWYSVNYCVLCPVLISTDCKISTS